MMMKKLMRKIHREQRGITGLETAIILIAFVVVASVFAYTALSAGLFSTQKSQEAVYSGLEETRSTLELKGGVVAQGMGELDDCDDDPVAWSAAEPLPSGITSVTPAGDTTDKKEGSASVNLTIVTDASPGTGLLAYHNINQIDLSSNTSIKLWIKSDTALTGADQLQLAIDEDSNCASPSLINIGTLSAGTWSKKTLSLSGIIADDRNAVVSIGLYTGSALPASSTINVWLDIIETQPVLSTTNPMKAYADELVFTVANALGGEPIGFTEPTDGDNDGIPDSGSSHKVVISFSDEYQQVTDLAWTKTAIGKDDGDDLLEDGEKFQITVDLSYVNNNAGSDSEKLGAYRTFTLEVKPPKGAVLNIQRTMPGKITEVNNLN